jgi:hypothetical protein
MSDDLSRVAERLRQNRTARQTEFDAAHGREATRSTVTGGTFVAGDRVFDTATGGEGVVVSATGFGSAQLGTVGVRLDTGASVTRRPGELILRPAPPGGNR